MIIGRKNRRGREYQSCPIYNQNTIAYYKQCITNNFYSFIYYFAKSKQTGAVQIKAGLNGGLRNDKKARPQHRELH